MPKHLENKEVGELWRRYKPLEGDSTADLVLGLIRKLVFDGAHAFPYGDWAGRVTHPLSKYGIALSEWDSEDLKRREP